MTRHFYLTYPATYYANYQTLLIYQHDTIVRSDLFPSKSDWYNGSKINIKLFFDHDWIQMKNFCQKLLAKWLLNFFNIFKSIQCLTSRKEMKHFATQFCFENFFWNLKKKIPIYFKLFFLFHTHLVWTLEATHKILYITYLHPLSFYN